MMTDAELDMLQDLAGKVSPDGWRVYKGKFGDYGIRADSGKKVVPIYEKDNQWDYSSYGIESLDDAMFIAAAKKYMLELIHELRKARKEIEIQKEVIWFFGDAAKSLVRDEVERTNGGAQNGKVQESGQDRIAPEAMLGVYRELRECREKLRVYKQQKSLFCKNGEI